MIHKNYIGGQWQAAVGAETYERFNPFDQSLVAAYQDSDERDVALASNAARDAFDNGPWPRMSAFDRAAVFQRAATLVRQGQDTLADTMTREVGQPRSEMLKSVGHAADALDYYAGLITERRDEAVGGQRTDAIGMILKEPVGAVGSLTAWNAPLSLTHKACPGLAAGCTIVTKPAHQSAGAVIELAKIFEEAGLPPGALNVVTSARENGAVVGQAIAESDRLDMVTFTGSSATGKAVMRAAANNLKRVKLELGGKSPNIVFADAENLDHIAAAVAKGIVRMAGQSCQAGSRLLVQEAVKDQFMELLVKHVSMAKLGDPFHADTTCGPLVSETQLQRVSSFVELGKSTARLVLGGARPDRADLQKGFFLQPTIFDQVAHDARIAQEEAFGPVLSVVTFKDEQEAIRIANSTAFGLVAGCWTSNLNTTMRVAKSVTAGILWVNCYRDDSPLKYMPTGFRKQSGIGSEMGPEGLEAFLETKSVMIRISP
ncbi:aldehyde dehydrogenase [Hydrogenophaga sp.]|uniref:aldehyde dehydrogenase family protein n=1 Tax=Hydrogenophaga sp. TaxID=1904254 RepID=UPI0027255C7E|nr:aldehyde dehydrogenase family protein [Hydrogenophaga sp.]MDO9433967.1 aldehyde dehydrogenase family protein [Hydrogenophaga sp.]